MDTLSRDEVRGIDRYAIDTLGVSGLVLMENAGRNAADAIERFGRQRAASSMPSAAIVAGAGNNGGDGYVIARHLAMRGWRVETFLTADDARITGDAAANLAILRNLSHIVHSMAGRLEDLSRRLREFDLVVDAVAGTGLVGPLRGDLAAIIEQINASGKPVVAVDIPSGLDCDTGQPLEAAVRAQLTVTFVAKKKGFDAPGAAAYTGQIVVADIGIPAETVRRRIAGQSSR